MKMDSEDIRKLTLDEIAGSITPADKEFLHNAISKDKNAFAIWNEIHTCFSDPSVQEAIERLPEVLPLDHVLRKGYISKLNQSNKIIQYGFAALVSGIIAICWLFYTNNGSNRNKSNSYLIADESNIELQLSDGSKIDLGQEQDGVQVGNITLFNKSNTLHYLSSSKAMGAQAIATLNVPPGKDYKVQLSDGSEVWLNSATSLYFPLQFFGNSREVTVRGEAYFKVAHNAKSPFLVHLPHCTIKVLGTEFNINTYDTSNISVALVEGSVRINANHDSILLQPGYKASFRKDRHLEREPFDLDILAWRQGLFIFHDSRLEEVLNVVQRWYGLSIKLDNQELNEKKFYGVIDRNQPVEELLERLKAINKIDYYVDENKVFHIR